MAGETKKRLSLEAFKKAFGLFHYVLPYKVPFILGMVFLVLGTMMFMLVIGIPSEVYNVLDGKSRFGLGVNQLFLLLFGLLVIQGVFSYFRIHLFNLVSERAMGDLRNQLYQKLISLDVHFFEKNRTGDLTSRITNDISLLQNVFSTVLAEMLRQVILLALCILLMLYFVPKLTLIMLAVNPPLIIIAIFWGKRIGKATKERQEALAESNVIVEETLQNIHTVKSYTNERFELLRYGASMKRIVDISLRAGKAKGLFAAFIITALFGGFFFVMWMAALMVQNGQMPPGDLFLFVLTTAIIGTSIAGLGNFYAEILSADGATQRIREILAMPSEVDINHENNDWHRYEGDIRFENVNFNYPSRPEIEVLKGIDIHVASGQRIALVGSSGSGKSTITQLLLRFYPLGSGNIQVDGLDIKTLNISDYRRNIAIVPQEVLLFGGTIRENIDYGRRGSSDEEIIAAAKQANAWDFIASFPEGLDTVVGERGIKLSGGQRQRIAIARAILKDPSILILDEATSSLDAESERLVQEALNRLMEGRTSIIIAHRLATIKDVDKIYVIDNGKVVEKGTHSELFERENGVYRGLAKLQFDVKSA